MFWRAEPKADQIIKQTTEIAAYWHLGAVPAAMLTASERRYLIPVVAPKNCSVLNVVSGLSADVEALS